MMSVQNKKGSQALRPDPPFLSSLFANPAFAVIWLVVRVYVGWQWLSAGIEKFENPAWTSTGLALKGFWEKAVVVPVQGKPVITYDWYGSFLQGLLNGGHYTWFSKLVIFGEITIGIALILGAFVGVAALFGAFMNLNFMLAGSASTNPVMFALAILLILAWKIAGYWGLDRWLLATIRTPWEWLGNPSSLQPYPPSS
jgi:thiosulfate dehydrogenase (quinone) large subunit